jgi:thymidine phosphorylase
VTATVPSIPLITASILSKKVAAGVEALILDVKWGSGAFMKSLEQARELANSLVRVGNRLGVKTEAVISDMNQPLGQMIGNAVEIRESLEVLKGGGPPDVVALTLELGARLLVSAGIVSEISAGKQRLQNQIDSGTGLERFQEMVSKHDGDIRQLTPLAKKHTLAADESGFVARINAERLGLAVIEMGGGRRHLGDTLDFSTGIEFLVKIGDAIETGQPIAHVYCPENKIDYVKQLIRGSIGCLPTPVESLPLIVEFLSKPTAS